MRMSLCLPSKYHWLRSNLLTLSSRVLFEKPPVAQLFKNFQTLLWSPKFPYRVLKIPPLVPLLSLVNPVHTTPSYFSRVHFNIILPPPCMSSFWCLSFWLSHQNPVCIPLLTTACYILYPSYLLWLGRSNYIWLSVQVKELHTAQFSPAFHYFIPFRYKYCHHFATLWLHVIVIWNIYKLGVGILRFGWSCLTRTALPTDFPKWEHSKTGSSDE
jgi:hypothetical protein